MEFTKSPLSNPYWRQLTLRRLLITLFSALLLTPLALVNFEVHAHPAEPLFVQDRVVIRPRKIVVVRSGALARRFPERRKAIITYPVLSGLSNSAALNRVRSAIALEKIFGYSLADYRSDTWLSEFEYKVNYNRDHLLDITFTQSGMAAYPDEHQKHFLINLRDGNIVNASDVFEAGRLQALAALVDGELQREIRQLTKENRESNNDPEQRESIGGAYENLKFEVANLNQFSVGATGVTFLYDAGFPHIIKALEPEGRYFFTYSALRDFIRRDGLLAKFRN